MFCKKFVPLITGIKAVIPSVVSLKTKNAIFQVPEKLLNFED